MSVYKGDEIYFLINRTVPVPGYVYDNYIVNLRNQDVDSDIYNTPSLGEV